MLALAVEGSPAEAIPPTIHALLAARLDRLPGEERAVLERAAVIGREFTAGAVNSSRETSLWARRSSHWFAGTSSSRIAC